ncbi:MAG TPA: alpha/beta fold hydrolase, partial [Gemmatimonadales bacterium]|nr:alpha/beta fold hydrolase [Gemmatimonadales bacterium]
MATLTAPDGTQLIYDTYEPVSPRAALLFLHGWSDHAGRWASLGERLGDAGYAVYALDQRGHGRSGGRRGHLSRFSQLLGDLQAFRRAVRRRRAELRHVLLGHSFGGLVALRYLETQPSDPVTAAVLSSPWLALAAPPPRLKLALARVL